MDVPSSLNIAILGAGPLGRRLAFHAARTGFRVWLEDVMPSSLRHAEEALRLELGAALISKSGEPLVTFATTIEEAAREADLAIDCVPDELESKLEIFSLLDRMAPPRTVFATPTMSLSIADLASCTYRPGQCVGMAIHASQLSGESGAIPIRVTSRTTPEAQELVCAFWRRLGYSPQVEMDTAEAMLK